VLTIAIQWLRAHVPSYDGPNVIVQGDTGPGNFLFADDRVTAIVDWELAHIGDPMDDIAWLTLRSVQDPFPDLNTRLHEYQQHSGHALDADRIRFYRVLAEAKILAMNHGMSLRDRSDAAGGGGDIGARLIFGQLHRRLCVEALADASGVRLDTEAADGAASMNMDPDTTALDEIYNIVFEQFREVIVPRITDTFAAQRTKGMVRVLKYLAAAAPRRSAFTALECAEIGVLLGSTTLATNDLPAARSALSVAIRNESVAVAPALCVLHRGVLRDNELLRGASGALADRHYNTLDGL
jgi:hypothetical protein